MLVVVVAVHLLLGGPPVLMVLASGNRALPGPRVRLLVLGQIARTLELLVAADLTALLGGELLGAGVLLPPSHGAHDLLFVLQLLAGRALESRHAIGIVLNRLTGGHRDHFPVLLNTD